MPRGPVILTQYDRHLWAIGSVLAEVRTRHGWKFGQGVPWQPVGKKPIVGPQCKTYTIETRPQDQKKVLCRAEEFAQAAGSQMVRVYRDHGVIRVEFTLPANEWQDVPLDSLKRMPGRAAVGLSTLGLPVWVGWQAPHKAVFGSTQSGKSTFLADLIINIATHHTPDDYRLLILNPKNDLALNPFQNLAHLGETPMVSEYEDCENLLRYTLKQMEGRREGRFSIQQRWVVVVDEVAQLVENRKAVSPILTQLSQLAGGLNINLVLASQSANPTVFGKKGSLTVTNLPSRFVFQLPNSQSHLAVGLPGQHTEKLGGIDCQGDGLLSINGKVTRFRAALPSQADYNRLPRAEVIESPGLEKLASDRLVDRDPEKVAIYRPDLKPPETQKFEIERFGEFLAWAVFTNAGTSKIREQFSIGQKPASTIRKVALIFRQRAKELKR